MAKICFPHHTRGEFGSLDEAFRYLIKREYCWYWFTLTEIVKYNVFYRDYLRKYGVDALIKEIVDEVAEIADDKKSLQHLRDWAAREKLANYDIQCYNIRDKVTILGHTFTDLNDIIKHCQIVGKEFIRGFECFTPQNVSTYPDIHIGELYENYPIFDSYDLGDNRTYQNYIFRDKEITKQELEAVLAISHKGNFCMVHEQISPSLLPILYYSGEGNYMLLATNK